MVGGSLTGVTITTISVEANKPPGSVARTVRVAVPLRFNIALKEMPCVEETSELTRGVDALTESVMVSP